MRTDGVDANEYLMMTNGGVWRARDRGGTELSSARRGSGWAESGGSALSLSGV